jgi:hypothetical protein
MHCDLKGCLPEIGERSLGWLSGWDQTTAEPDQKAGEMERVESRGGCSCLLLPVCRCRDEMGVVDVGQQGHEG